MDRTRHALFGPLLAGAAALVLAGCRASLPAHYDGAEKVARNEVHLVRMTHEVPGGPDGLDEQGRSDVIAFLNERDVGYGDGVSLIAGEGFSPKAGDDVARILRAYGLSLERPPALSEEPRGGSAILVLDRYVVTPPDCPNSILDIAKNYANAGSPAFGCATVINIGQMVANPRDLLTGESEAGPNTGKATQAIRQWREDVPEFVKPVDANRRSGSSGGTTGSGGN